MDSSKFMVIALLTFLSTLSSYALSGSIQERFHRCIFSGESAAAFPPFSALFLTPQLNKSSFDSTFSSYSQNNRCSSPSPSRKPSVIFVPSHESHVQAAVVCSKHVGIPLRVRSGGHDFECLSYTSRFHSPFVVVDMSNLRRIKVDIKAGTAWVNAGATLGQLYNSIAKKSNAHGFPAGIWKGIGIGGHITGGGSGYMARKYGLAADNVVDARIVDAGGDILDRNSMGEDLFWAIRGGGGGSFGVILSWKVKLVPVPETVTIFMVTKTLRQGATKILHRWQQVCSKLDDDLHLSVNMNVVNDTKTGKRTVQTLYNALFLGNAERLIGLMEEGFPELGLKREDCIETSWVGSVLQLSFFPANATPEILARPDPPAKSKMKYKFDYVKEPIPESGLEGLWRRLLEEDSPALYWNPLGGMMGRIPESEIPFPHRKGVIFESICASTWEDGLDKKHIDWVRGVYEYLGSYVPRSPRAAYVNGKDLDLGMNKKGNTSFREASGWGCSYFKSNFKRLVAIKNKGDPENLFRHEQSIPTIFR